MRILGVDPGSRLTGYGCIDVVGRQLVHVSHGTLKLSQTGEKPIAPFEDRLLSIFQGLSQIILQYQPQVMVVERVFFAKNAVSALKLGQARGVAIVTGKIHSLQMAEYSPTQVKLAVVGHGQADKQQVARMVQLLIGEQKFSTFDASDGLALAICHAQSTSFGPSSGALQSHLVRRNKRNLSLAESVGIVDINDPAHGSKLKGFKS